MRSTRLVNRGVCKMGAVFALGFGVVLGREAAARGEPLGLVVSARGAAGVSAGAGAALGLLLVTASAFGAIGVLGRSGRALRSGGATTQPVSASVAKRIRKFRIAPNYPRKLSFCFRIVAKASASLHRKNGLVCSSNPIVDGTVGSCR